MAWRKAKKNLGLDFMLKKVETEWGEETCRGTKKDCLRGTGKAMGDMFGLEGIE